MFFISVSEYVPLKIITIQLQLNKYETALNFIQLNQNLTLDCLLIKAKQFYDQVMQELRKNREIQLNQQTIQCQVLAYLNKI